MTISDELRLVFAGWCLLGSRWPKLCPPLLRLVVLAERFVQPHQPLSGFVHAVLCFRRDFCFPLLQALVALREQWLSLGILPLTQQRPAKHRLSVVRRPGVGLLARTDGPAIAQRLFRFGVLVLQKQG